MPLVERTWPTVSEGNISPESILFAPLRRKKPTTYLVNSMPDLFHENVPEKVIDQVFAVMALCPQHTFQVLTKRARRMREYLQPHLDSYRDRMIDACDAIAKVSCCVPPQGEFPWKHRGNWYTQCKGDTHLPNVWLGVNVEYQHHADRRVPDLLATPAAVRFVSVKPLLGLVDFNSIDFAAYMRSYRQKQDGGEAPIGRHVYDPTMEWPLLKPFDHFPSGYSSPGLDWIIVDGESGPGARPTHPDWVRSIRDQCAAADVPFFFNKWGEWIDADSWHRQLHHGGTRFNFGNKAINPDTPLTFDQAQGLAEASGRGGKTQMLSDGTTMIRVGKRAAGRLLDGVEHNAMPGGDVVTPAQRAACLFAKTQAESSGTPQAKANQMVRELIEAVAEMIASENIEDKRPIRLQLSRRKGFNLQALSLATNGLEAVAVARPSNSGNPFTIKDFRQAGFPGNDTEIARRCVEAFRVWIDPRHWLNNRICEESAARREKARAMLPYLRGKNLACFCALDQPCHADVLLELANRPICEAVG